MRVLVAMKYLLATLMILVSCAHSSAKAPATKSPPPKKPAEHVRVMNKFQDVFESTKSFKAAFEQSVTSKIMETTDTSKGFIYVLRPDKFRWDSETEGFTQIINGKKLWHVQPKARRGKTLVTIYEDFTQKADPQFLEFITGKLKLRDHYNWTVLKNNKASLEVKLSPKKKGREAYIAEIDKKRYFLASLSYETVDTKTKVSFSELKLNEPFQDKLFEYKVNSDDIVQKQ